MKNQFVKTMLGATTIAVATMSSVCAQPASPGNALKQAGKSPVKVADLALNRRLDTQLIRARQAWQNELAWAFRSPPTRPVSADTQNH
jgi:hypothetical protein